MGEELKGIVRIGDADVLGNKTLFFALNQIRGVSDMMANAICVVSGLDKNLKVGSLSDAQVEKLENLIKSPEGIPSWLYNRRKDLDTGVDKHLISANLKLQREFDVKNMKKIKSYKGMRHSMGLPVRGQNTRAHFRRGKSIGVKKAKKGKKG
jgi:small subunit ribosomal protein S13